MSYFENIEREGVALLVLLESGDELFEIDGFKKRLESRHSRITNYIMGSTEM